MGALELVVGVAVLLLTLASQTGLLGMQDFATVALIGIAGAAFCLVMVLTSRSRAAIVGLVLSLLPVALLAFFLATSDG
ncbi:MAG: hypothetical protein H7270_00665 [Dermatophilaceae bacterium]|nr:hypothetical protein [Dermatophilaceae bacterium]